MFNMTLKDQGIHLRNEKIYQLWLSYRSYEEIAEMHKLSAFQVWKILVQKIKEMEK